MLDFVGAYGMVCDNAIVVTIILVIVMVMVMVVVMVLVINIGSNNGVDICHSNKGPW